MQSSPAVISHAVEHALPDVDHDYWNALIDEYVAAQFMGLTVRTMQAYRYKGGGPCYVAIGSRPTVRYRRADLREWAEARLRRSTSDID